MSITGYNSSYSLGHGGTHLREKLSHQLENIVKRTQKNLNEGVFKNPNQQPNLGAMSTVNYISATHTPNYRANSMGLRQLQEPTHSHRMALDMRAKPGLDGLSFMSQTNFNDPLAQQPSPKALLSNAQQKSQQPSGPFNQKSNSVGDAAAQLLMKRPGTTSNLDFKGGLYNQTIEQESNNEGGGEEDDLANNMVSAGHLRSQNPMSLPRPRTSQPNSIFRDKNANIMRELSGQRPGDAQQHRFGSGAGAGDVNTMLASKYNMNREAQTEIYNRLHDENNLNQMNLDQRQRMFEDIIIQRVKVIQAYIKKQFRTVKSQLRNSEGSAGGGIVSNPVILNSIHNDGMALDLKIKDIVKWKFEAYEQKSKNKDDRLIQLEAIQNRQEQQLKEALSCLNDSTVAETEQMKQHVIRLQERIEQHERSLNMITEQLTKQLSSSVTEQVTSTMMQNIMPQLDNQIQTHIEDHYKKLDLTQIMDNRLKDMLSNLEKQQKKNEEKLNEQIMENNDTIIKQLQVENKQQEELVQNIQNDLENSIQQLVKDQKKDQTAVRDLEVQLTQTSSEQNSIGKSVNKISELEAKISKVLAEKASPEDVIQMINQNNNEKGHYVTKDDFNTLSDVFQEKFKDFNTEVREELQSKANRSSIIDTQSPFEASQQQNQADMTRLQDMIKQQEEKIKKELLEKFSLNMQQLEQNIDSKVTSKIEQSSKQEGSRKKTFVQVDQEMAGAGISPAVVEEIVEIQENNASTNMRSKPNMVRSAAPPGPAGKPSTEAGDNAKANPQSMSPNELPADPQLKAELSADSPQRQGDKKPMKNVYFSPGSSGELDIPVMGADGHDSRVEAFDPTPSSTSKLAQIQPAAQSSAGFSPQPVKTEVVPARASRYQAEDEEDEAADALVVDQDDIGIILDEDERRLLQPTPVNRAPIDPADEVWDDDDIIDLEDAGASPAKKVDEPVQAAPAQIFGKQTEPIKDEFDEFDDVFAGEPKKADKKQDVMRSGMDFGKQGNLKDMLKNEPRPSEEEAKPAPLLTKKQLIENPIAWKGFVPDPVQLRNNIFSAVDNQINNMVVELMNEYNSLKQIQYQDVDKINKDLNKNQSGFSPKAGSKPRKQDEFDDILEGLEGLQDAEGSGGDPPRSMRESTFNKF